MARYRIIVASVAVAALVGIGLAALITRSAPLTPANATNTPKATTTFVRTTDLERDSALRSSHEERNTERQQAQRTIAALDQVFYTEARDPAWASEIEAAIAKAFEHGDVSVGYLVNAECREHLCRVEVDPAGNLDQLLKDILHTDPFSTTSGFYSLNPETVTLHLYLARQDVRLQELPGFVETMHASGQGG